MTKRDSKPANAGSQARPGRTPPGHRPAHKGTAAAESPAGPERPAYSSTDAAAAAAATQAAVRAQMANRGEGQAWSFDPPIVQARKGSEQAVDAARRATEGALAAVKASMGSIEEQFKAPTKKR